MGSTLEQEASAEQSLPEVKSQSRLVLLKGYWEKAKNTLLQEVPNQLVGLSLICERARKAEPIRGLQQLRGGKHHGDLLHRTWAEELMPRWCSREVPANQASQSGYLDPLLEETAHRL